MRKTIANLIERILIYFKQYPIAYHTVDACVWRIVDERIQILLVQKPAELGSGKWRFAGGFVDVTDNTIEDAAIREVREETKLEVVEPRYIGTAKIDDPRYRNKRHKIITSFYALSYRYGEVGKGYDDVAVTKWFDLDSLSLSDMNKIHVPLYHLLKLYKF